MVLLGLNTRRVLERASDDVNRFVGKHWGDKFPFYFVCEYPKSGGTWLSRMVSDYLKIPFPQHSVFPVGCAGRDTESLGLPFEISARGLPISRWP